MQNLELGDFGGMHAAGFGDRGLLFVGNRTFHDAAVRIFLTQPLHREFHRALWFVVVHADEL